LRRETHTHTDHSTTQHSARAHTHTHTHTRAHTEHSTAHTQHTHLVRLEGEDKKVNAVREEGPGEGRDREHGLKCK